MSIKINDKYIEKYAHDLTQKVCDPFYTKKKYITGQDILQITPNVQVNFFVIKKLFDAWQSELEKLKSNPYFDYRDNAVHEALNDFMNVLSRSIKVERSYFEPLLVQAVKDALFLALDPLGFYTEEFQKIPEGRINDYLKENKKYYKWHNSLIVSLIDRAGIAQSREAFIKGLETNYKKQKKSLQDANELLNTLQSIIEIDTSILLVEDIQQTVETPPPHHEQLPVDSSDKAESALQPECADQVNFEPSLTSKNEETLEKDASPEVDEFPDVADDFSVAALGERAIDPEEVWQRFELEQYSIMKGSIYSLAENLAINQRFMFTKKLFVGNPDLLKHALLSLDECESFADAINLINKRYLAELQWDKNDEAVIEFLQLVFRRFDQR
jgi:hypothetical protein